MQDVAMEIAGLSELPVSELQARYEKLFDGKPCHSSHKQFLVRRIAWRMQELAYGGMPNETRRRLEQLASEAQLAVRRGDAQPSAPQQRKHRRRDRRLPMPGTVITRRYQDRDLSVTVLDKGFEFEGRKYRSLSGIAREVTGAHWNGLLFFNLA